MLGKKQIKNKLKEWFKPIKSIGLSKERSFFLENLARLVSSGVPMIESLESVQADLSTKRMKEAVGKAIEMIKQGVPLWKALNESGYFPSHIISLVKIGEKTGRLPENLQVVARQEKKSRTFRSKIFSAMMYPVFVLVLTLLIGVGIAWFILPNLSSVFSSLQMDLPFITRWLIEAGQFLDAYGSIVIPIFLLVVGLVVFFLFVFPPTNQLGKRLLFYIPGVSELIKEVELARMGYLLGSLLGAGIVVTEALDSLSKATRFPLYADLYEHMEERVGLGHSFKKAISEYDNIDSVMPSTVRGMIMAGERSGNLPEVLSQIGETYEEKLDTTTKNLTVILEPILLFIVWIAVVGVALAVILPVYSLVGDLNAGGA